MAYLELLRNKRVTFLGDSLSKRWFAGTTSTVLRQLPDLSVTPLAPLNTTAIINDTLTGGHAIGALAGVHFDEHNVTFRQLWLSFINEDDLRQAAGAQGT